MLLREITDRGYAGGISQLKAWLAPMKRTEPEPVVRFETPPGKQMQADFTHVRRGRDPLIALVATMGYSRATFVKFAAREDAATLCSGLREAFDYFGGVPEHVLFDNTKAVVIERDAYGPGLHRWNDELKALAESCGFTPRLCRPYRAKTKGKVERPFRYIREDFFLGRSFRSRDDLNDQFRQWPDQVATVRTPPTTPPALSAHFPQEPPRTHPFPPRPSPRRQVSPARPPRPAGAEPMARFCGEAILASTPPELLAPAINVGDRPACLAAATCSAPNNELVDVSEPVTAVPNQPISGDKNAKKPPAPAAQVPSVTV